jgi:hypothetical protein
MIFVHIFTAFFGLGMLAIGFGKNDPCIMIAGLANLMLAIHNMESEDNC